MQRTQETGKGTKDGKRKGPRSPARPRGACGSAAPLLSSEAEPNAQEPRCGWRRLVRSAGRAELLLDASPRRDFGTRSSGFPPSEARQGSALLPVRPWQDVTAAHPRPRASSSPPWPFLIQEPPSAGDSQVPSRGRTVAGAGLSAGAHAGATRQPLCPRSPCHGGRGTARPDLPLPQAASEGCTSPSRRVAATGVPAPVGGGAQSAGPRAQDRGPRPACTPLALPARSGRGASRWHFVLAGCHPLTRVLAAALSRGATVIGVVGRSALRAICHELKLHADRFTQ